jgi:hypothetical protein
MFSLLRDALVNNLPVTADYLIDPGKQNGIAIRVALTPNPIQPTPPVVVTQRASGQVLPASSAAPNPAQEPLQSEARKGPAK